MSMITGSIKGLLQVKFKPRHDGYTDQYNRIFMVKMAMVSCMLLGLNWFKDTITCVIPGTSAIDKKYVHQACWIQGFYVYRDLNQVEGGLKYYGIPNRLASNGMRPDGMLCEVGHDPQCTAMEKTFYLQYQWFPFYIGVIGFLFYLPYILFRYINTDLISLKTSIKVDKPDIEKIVKNYFNYQINPPLRMKLKVIANIGIKIAYLLVNVIAFIATDSLLNGDFRNYGSKWINWSRGSNEYAYDYTESRHVIKPGEKLLPNFGICDVWEFGKDLRSTLNNDHRMVCEISQNVLYQYVLILLWFCYVFGMLISCVGLIMQIVDHTITMSCFLFQGNAAKKVYQSISLRECEYLEYVRKKNLPVYGKLIERLQEERLDHHDGNGYDDHSLHTPNHHEHLLDKAAKI